MDSNKQHFFSERTQSTSETMAPQRLRGKPSFMPTCSALLPVRCNPKGKTLRGQHPNRLSTRNDGQAQSNHNQQQRIAPSRQRAVQTTLLIYTGAEPIHPVHASSQLGCAAVAPRSEVIFLPFWRGFYTDVPLTSTYTCVTHSLQVVHICAYAYICVYACICVWMCMCAYDIA